jgi:uncharacterized protein YigE (DUF2233 family)
VLHRLLITACAGISLAAHARADWAIHEKKLVGTPAPGVSVHEMLCRNGSLIARVTCATFHESEYTLRVIDSPNPGSTTLASILSKSSVIAGVNGAYFHSDFKPVGLVVVDGKTQHPFEKAKLLSGILTVRSNGTISIIRSGQFSAKASQPVQALQCGPMLVEKGSPVTGLNATRSARRTAVATDPKGKIALVYITSVTLADAAQILSLPDVFGTWKPTTALNLDGGSSSGFWAGTTLHLPEIKRVRNFLAIAPKKTAK